VCDGALHGENLTRLDASERLIDHALKAAGLETYLDVRQRWEIGEHVLEVSKWYSPDSGFFCLRVWSGWPPHLSKGSTRGALDPAEIYAYATAERLFAFAPRDELEGTGASGGNTRRGGSTRAKWKLRLAIDCGIVSRPKLVLPGLPEDAADTEKRTWHGIVSLLEVERCCGCHPPGSALMATPAFMAPWCGISEHEARDGISRLRRRSFLVKRGSSRLPGTPYSANLYCVAGDCDSDGQAPSLAVNLPTRGHLREGTP
jgi:hypothetical protein